MLKFNSIEEAFEYKGTDQIITIIDEEVYTLRRHINPDESLGGYVDTSSRIGNNCRIGENCIVYGDVYIDNNTCILNNVIIHNDVNIGQNCVIYDNVHIQYMSHIGNNTIINNKVSVYRSRIVGDASLSNDIVIKDSRIETGSCICHKISFLYCIIDVSCTIKNHNKDFVFYENINFNKNMKLIYSCFNNDYFFNIGPFYDREFDDPIYYTLQILDSCEINESDVNQRVFITNNDLRKPFAGDVLDLKKHSPKNYQLFVSIIYSLLKRTILINDEKPS